jgi:hypothetical protein
MTPRIIDRTPIQALKVISQKPTFFFCPNKETKDGCDSKKQFKINHRVNLNLVESPQNMKIREEE